MSSNNSNTTNNNNIDLNTLLALLQQQMGQGDGAAASGSPAMTSPALAAAPSVPLPGTVAQAQFPPQTNNQQTVPGNGSPHHQQQLASLLQSAKLLASVDPALATAAMEQAFALISQMSTPSMPPPNGGQPLRDVAVSNLPIISAPAQSTTTTTTTSLRSIANPGGGPGKSLNRGLQSKRSANGNAKVTFSSENNSSASLPIKLDPSANKTIVSSSRSLDNATTANNLMSEGANSPPSPVGLAVLQTWDLAKLESYAQRFKDCNQPVPNAVRIVIEDIQRKEQKLIQKRAANRKTAAASRSRKQQLIDELISSNAELRRQALVLSYLPDACMAIDVTGKIMFCSPQVQRILGYKIEEMEGANIERLLAPGSKNNISSLINDLLSAVTLTAKGEYGNFDYPDPNASGDSSNDANAISQRSERFPLLEVQVDDDNENGSNDTSSEHSSERDNNNNNNKNAEKKSSITTTMSSLTQKSLTSSNDISTEESNGPPKKKLKASITKKESSASYSEAMNVDDVMGASVTKNNADAKLSSLMHPRSNGTSEDSKGSTATTNGTITQVKDQQPSLRRHTQKTSNTPPENQKDSLDSGYRNSSEGSEDNSDSNSSSDFMKKGKRLRPLAPACSVWMVRSNLTTILCEVTSSIRTRRITDEDSQLGVTGADLSSDEPQEDEGETEILLCLRPLSKFRFRGNINQVDCVNGSEESSEKSTENVSSENNVSAEPV